MYIIVHFPLFADWHIDENVANYNNCSTGDIRLQDGSNEYEGRAEVCVNGVWGSICHNGWDKSDANAFCGQLGYSSYGTLKINELYTLLCGNISICYI